MVGIIEVSPADRTLLNVLSRRCACKQRSGEHSNSHRFESTHESLPDAGWPAQRSLTVRVHLFSAENHISNPLSNGDPENIWYFRISLMPSARLDRDDPRTYPASDVGWR